MFIFTRGHKGNKGDKKPEKPEIYFGHYFGQLSDISAHNKDGHWEVKNIYNTKRHLWY